MKISRKKRIRVGLSFFDLLIGTILPRKVPVRELLSNPIADGVDDCRKSNRCHYFENRDLKRNTDILVHDSFQIGFIIPYVNSAKKRESM
jgi:hypothetical protein